MVRVFPTGRDLTLTFSILFPVFVKMADLTLMFATDELSEDFLTLDFLICLAFFFSKAKNN